MPSSQIQSSTATNQSNVSVASKPPPPSKLPPPPPPPPKNVRPPPPPPPPPPRNSSQQLSSQSSLTSNQLCAGGPGGPGVSMILNNGSSMNSLNSAGRCSHFQTNGPFSGSSNHSGQRGFTRHGECGSRSSVSSHGSLHHHIGMHNVNANGNGSASGFGPGSCIHQPGLGCTWSGSGGIQHNHPNSTSMSDNESCNLSYNQESRISCPATQRNVCCNSHHLHGSTSKCQNQVINPNTNIRINGLNGANEPATNINRNNSFFNTENINVNSIPNSCCGAELNRNHYTGSFPHHHHHHNLHNIQLSSSSSLSSLQPVDPSTSSTHRCNMSSQSSTTPSIHPNIMGEPVQRPMVAHPPCSHVHRANGCNHHHQANCFDHHNPANVQQQSSHVCGGCSHSHNGAVHHESNLLSGKNCPSCTHHHCPQELILNRCSDVSNNDSLLSTAHTHNLSNSSTTTHTSNVAVKHQPQFHRPVLSRGGRSSSSQQYEQYGLSSAASTSSATASLSSYQNPVAYDDLVPLYPSSKIHQPLPPPPPPPPLPPAKSQPASPAHQMFINTTNNNVSMVTPAFVGTPTHMQPQQQAVPPPPPPPLQQSSFTQSLPPLPPKPVSPNASSCSTQITTIRTSPSLQNQPITRVTSQAGVQNPLPSSDVPPPLPPLNPGSRTQLLVNSLMTRNQSVVNDNQTSTMTNFVNLSYNRGGIITEAERKTEALTRQVELELEQQQKAGEPHGICQKCGNKIMPSQEACKAMNQIYHASCFVCCECGRTLKSKNFYPVGDKVYCEEDFKYTGHMQSLEKCAECSQPIFDMILPAIGKSYHPKCFKCCVCGLCLDGVPFTIDRKNKIYCVKDYHNLYSPKCAACGKSISPIDGTDETVRVVSMDKDYHIDCYCCEDCGLQLTDEEPSRSYPLDNHLLCQQCHINRLSKMQAALSLN